MPKIAVPEHLLLNPHYLGGFAQKKINVTQSTWHAAHSGGSAVNYTSGFTDPSSAEADRIPELELTNVGTPTVGDYVLIGTWNGAAQTETITSVAGDTVKATKPFDTITSWTGPDPGSGETLTLHKGDSYASPPARAVYSGAGGDLEVQLFGESAVQTLSSVAAGYDLRRSAVRVGHDNTTIAAPYFVW